MYGNASDNTTVEKCLETNGSGLLASQQIAVESIAVVRVAIHSFQ